MRRVLEIAFVFAVVCLVFGRASGYGFVNCDDYDYVLKYGAVSDGVAWTGVKWAFSNVSEAIWMPLTWISYMLDYDMARLLGAFDPSVDGLGVAGVMHAHSVLLHAANAVLLFLLLARVLGGMATDGTSVVPVNGQDARCPSATVCALVATLLWAIHPLRVESVAWVASRKDVLSLFWELLAFHAWLGVWSEKGKMPVGPVNGQDARCLSGGSLGVVAYGLTVICFCASCCAKPSAMTFPFLVMILDRFVSGRWLGWLAYVPLLVLGAAVGGLAAWAQHAGGAMIAMSAVPFWWRLLNAMAAFGIYAWHEVCPAGLGVQCLARWPSWPRFLVPGVALSLVTVWYAVRYFRNHFGGFQVDWLFAAVLWCCIAVAPFLGVANFGIHAFADRFTYVPSIGLGFAVLWALNRFRARASYLTAGLGLSLCALYGVAAWRQTGYWSDDGALYARTLEADGEGNAEAHVSLGMWAWEVPHDLPRALRHFRAGWELDADRAGRVGHLFVMALCERGEMSEAQERLSQLGAWSERQTARHRRTSGGHSRTTLNYQVARAYYFSCMDATRSEAEAICGRLEGISPEHPDVLYLRLHLAGLCGDADTAQTVRRKLSGMTSEYLHYRFLNQPSNHDAPTRCATQKS